MKIADMNTLNDAQLLQAAGMLTDEKTRSAAVSTASIAFFMCLPLYVFNFGIAFAIYNYKGQL